MHLCNWLAYTEVFRGFAEFDRQGGLESYLGMKLTQASGCMAALILLVSTIAAEGQRFEGEAVRLNNRGVAQMGQQFTEKAEQSFSDALKKDPKLAQAAINDGIALMTLQRLDEAKKALQAAVVLDPKSAQAWYNLGLAQHSDNELDAALASFQQAVKLDPRDADSYYFEGVCYREMKQFDSALVVLKQALAINPLHASSEFAMARTLQSTGQKEEAKDPFQAFSTHDQHQDFSGDRFGLWRARALLHCHARGRTASADFGDDPSAP